MDSRYEGWAPQAQERFYPRLVYGADRRDEQMDEYQSWRSHRPVQAGHPNASEMPMGEPDTAFGKMTRGKKVAPAPLRVDDDRSYGESPFKTTNIRAGAALLDSPTKSDSAPPSPAGAPDAAQPEQAPTDNFAFTWFKATHPHHWWSVFSTDPSDLKQMSLGVSLYFQFQRQAAALFLALSVLAAPAMAAMISGNFYADNGLRFFSPKGNFPSWETTTLGSFGPAYGTTTVNSTIALPNNQTVQLAAVGGPLRLVVAGVSYDKPLLMRLFVWLDLFICGVFLVWLAVFRRRQQRQAEAQRAEAPRVEDYTVQVFGLPPDATVEEVHTLFDGAFGTVVEAQQALNDEALLALSLRRSARHGRVLRALAELDLAIARGRPGRTAAARLRAEREAEALLALEAEMRELQQRRIRGEGVRCASALVTFREEGSRAAALQALGPPGSLGAPALALRGRPLRAAPAPPPHDLLWENLAAPPWERFARRAAAHCARFLLVAGGFFAVTAFAAVVVRGSKPLPPTALCRAQCAYQTEPSLFIDPFLKARYFNCEFTEAAPQPLGNGTNATNATAAAGGRRRALLDSTAAPPAAAAAATVSGLGNATALSITTCAPAERICRACFCGELLRQGAVGTEPGFCRDWAASDRLIVDVAFAVTPVLLALNVLLGAANALLCRFERHPTLSAQQAARLRGKLLLHFAAVALVYLIVRADWQWTRGQLAGKTPRRAAWLRDSLLSGPYGDITPAWYKDVGFAVVGAQFGVPLISAARVACLKVFASARRASGARSALTLHEALAAYRGTDFDVASRAGEKAALVFVALSFSSAMPVLLPVTFFSLALGYWLEKFELLRVSRAPLPYGDEPIAELLGALPWAVLPNLLFGLWAYSAQFAPPSAFTRAAIARPARLALDGWRRRARQPVVSLFGVFDPDEAAARLGQEAAGWFTLALLLFTAVAVLLLLARAILSALSRLRCLPSRTPFLGRANLEAALQSGDLAGPRSFSISDNPKYRDAFQEPALPEKAGARALVEARARIPGLREGLVRGVLGDEGLPPPRRSPQVEKTGWERRSADKGAGVGGEKGGEGEPAAGAGVRGDSAGTRRRALLKEAGGVRFEDEDSGAATDWQQAPPRGAWGEEQQRWRGAGGEGRGGGSPDDVEDFSASPGKDGRPSALAPKAEVFTEVKRAWSGKDFGDTGAGIGVVGASFGRGGGGNDGGSMRRSRAATGDDDDETGEYGYADAAGRGNSYRSSFR